MRRTIATLSARTAGALSRMLRIGGGSSMPGVIIQRLDPNYIRDMAARLDTIVVVSGTNGKTTTASMIRAILRAKGASVIGNDTGANLLTGVATAFLTAPSDANAAVFELDEAWLPRAVRALSPTVLVLTNVFRDQLDRFGEAEFVARLLGDAAAAMPEGSVVVANADDPLLWNAVAERAPIGFGVRPAERSPAYEPGADAEPETCPRCGALLTYEWRTLAHLGKARCVTGDWAWSEPKALARISSSAGLGQMSLVVAGVTVTLKAGGMHNAYNAAAAVAAGVALGLPAADVAATLDAFQPRFGRSEEFTVGGRRIRVVLAKNPAGATAVIREIASDPGVGAVVVAVSDQAADGRDISWIWDADHEALARMGVPLIPSGSRARDVAVRLKYAGATPLAAAQDPAESIRAAIAACPPSRSVVVLATYTAMLNLRRTLTSRTGYLVDQPQ